MLRVGINGASEMNDYQEIRKTIITKGHGPNTWTNIRKPPKQHKVLGGKSMGDKAY